MADSGLKTACQCGGLRAQARFSVDRVGVVERRHLRPQYGTQVTPVQVSCSERGSSGAGLRSRGSKALRQCRPQPVTQKALVWQQVQDLPESSGAVKHRPVD